MTAVLKGWGVWQTEAAVLRAKLTVSGSFCRLRRLKGKLEPCDEEIEDVQAVVVRRLRHTHQHAANKCESVSPDSRTGGRVKHRCAVILSVLGKPQYRPLPGAVPSLPGDRRAFARRSVREFRCRGRQRRSYRTVLRIVPGDAVIP